MASEPEEEYREVASDQETDGLSAEIVFEILRNSRRRMVLEYLEETGRRATIKELVEHIASEEHDITSLDPSRPEYKSVYVALHQSHLPKMDDTGIVHYDQENKTVELMEASSAVFPYLHAARDAPQSSPADVSELLGNVVIVVPVSGHVQGTVRIEADGNALEISTDPPEDERDE